MNPIHPTVMWLTWRQLFLRKRLMVVGGFALAPLLIALIYRVSAADASQGAEGFLSTLNAEIVLGTVLPVIAVVLGTTAFGGEVDDGTLLYLLVKPIARWRFVMSKYVVAVLCTVAVMVPAVMLPWFLLRTAELTVDFPLAYLGGAVVGAILYSAAFMTLGIISRRALVLGLLYTVIFEAVMSRTFVGFKSFSIREYVLTAAHTIGEFAGAHPPVTIATVHWMGSIILVGATALSIWKLSRYEVAERL
jgi:ABC-2 type transport system permease protein